MFLNFQCAFLGSSLWRGEKEKKHSDVTKSAYRKHILNQSIRKALSDICMLNDVVLTGMMKFWSFRHETIMWFILIKLDSSMQGDARRYDLVTNWKRYRYSNCDCTVDLTVFGKPVSYNFLKIFLLKFYLFHFKKMFVIQRMPSSKEERKFYLIVS